MSSEAKCPFSSGARPQALAGTRGNADWWPNQLNLKVLHQQAPASSPMGAGTSTMPRPSRPSTSPPSSRTCTR